jgi:K+-sensing histidine kinase KdpD
MSEQRGHHKILLGMAAGVGKTFQMLQEGHAEHERGRDVVVGTGELERLRVLSAGTERRSPVR